MQDLGDFLHFALSVVAYRYDIIGCYGLKRVSSYFH